MYKFKTELINIKDEKSVTITLPRNSEIFDMAKEHGVYGNCFQICYNYNESEVGYENHTLHLIKENESTDIKHKLRYLGKYSPKFQSHFVFVYLQVSP